MRRLIHLTTGFLLASFALGTVAEHIDLQQYMAISGPKPQTVFRYGLAPSQTAELFRPEGPGPFPVAILIHGGCWLSKYGGLPQFRVLAAALSARGIATWNIEYRRVDEPGGGYPGTYQDVAAALDMLDAKGAQLDLDLRRLVAVGHSAGADLALWAAGRARIASTSPLFAEAPLRIPTVISLGGLPDLRNDAATIGRSCGLDVTTLIGKPSAARPDPFADTSPASMLPDGVNTVGINGAHDTIAPPEIASEYAALARKAGDQARTVAVENAGHLDEVTMSSPVWPVLNAEIRETLHINDD